MEHLNGCTWDSVESQCLEKIREETNPLKLADILPCHIVWEFVTCVGKADLCLSDDTQVLFESEEALKEITM